MVEITEGTPRADLIAHTAQDPSLNTLRKLADTQSQGYQWKQRILLRHRLDDEWGDTYSQMCLPKKYRDKCMNLAHERFGHLGQNTMSQNIKKHVHWPNMFSDIAQHCKSCDTCQRYTKSNPKPFPMQE